jgi:hypothetical protein
LSHLLVFSSPTILMFFYSYARLPFIYFYSHLVARTLNVFSTFFGSRVIDG